jgi:hypothetical protein
VSSASEGAVTGSWRAARAGKDAAQPKTARSAAR